MSTSDPAALSHLQRDAVLAELLKSHDLPPVVAADHAFRALIRSVVGQQLSVKAARAIATRVAAATGDFEPALLAAADPADLRALGMSWAKVRTVQAVAQAELSGAVDFAKLQNLSDEEVIAALVALPGIGRWTAEMFLMSGLGRPDVFSFGDLGLRRALEKHYPDADHAAVVESWRPYRSHAARLLWRSLDNAPKLSGG